jgi:Fructose-2,6-bisphosphatase
MSRPAPASQPAFVIVRHGNTFAAGEPPRRIGSRTDLPLTAAGHEQARALGAMFASRHWHFTRALFSPLLRTRQTAEAILESQPADADVVTELCDFLREIDHGPDEDQTEDAVMARIGAEAIAAWDARAEPPPGWQIDRVQRIAGWRALFVAPPAGGPTLLITSNGAARFALMADDALAAASANLSSLKLPTGGYGEIWRDGTGALSIGAWGLRP